MSEPLWSGRWTSVDRDAFDAVIGDVRDELERAMSMYPPMNSPAEGASILREEFEEAWEIVKQKPARRVLSDLRIELVQVAAVAIRMVLDVTNEERGRR